MAVHLATCRLAYGVLLAGCSIGCTPCSSHEVARAVSPDRVLSARLTETNAGATTSFGYDVSVEAVGRAQSVRVASLYGAVRNQQAYGVNLLWTDEHTLRIRYLSARSVSNVMTFSQVDGHPVDVVLESGIEDERAPAGGMFFNLQKHAR